jgi:hypothetical protein
MFYFYFLDWTKKNTLNININIYIYVCLIQMQLPMIGTMEIDHGKFKFSKNKKLNNFFF